MKEDISKIRIIKCILLVVFLSLFLLVLKNVISNDIKIIDTTAYNYISKLLISDNATPVIKKLTNLGGEYCIIFFAILLIIIFKQKRLRINIALNLIIVAALNWLIKHIIQRPRPIENRLVEESGFSFPSGHSMIGMAFYGYLIYLIYKNVKNNYIKVGAITVLSILILFIGLTRIYLGVHYPSDVLAGFLLGAFYLILFIHISNYIEGKTTKIKS